MAPTAPRLSGLRSAAWLLAGATILALALPGTCLSALALLGDPAPRALAAGVPVLALVWAWLRLREQTPPRSAHGRWIGAPLVLLTAGSLVLMVVAGVSPENRLPLLAPLAAALVLAIGGGALLRHLAGPLALLLLAWPPLHDAVAHASTPFLLGISGMPGVALARAAGTEVVAIPGGEAIYLCPSPHGSLLATLDATCSGASGLLALVILAIPVIALRRPSPWRVLPWLGLGLGLVLAGNSVRIALLFWLASVRGPDAFFCQVHVLAGGILVLLVWIGMLAALPLLGSRRPLPAPPPPEDPPSRRAPLLACVPSLAACLLLESAELRWNQPPGIPPRPPAAEMPVAPVQARTEAEPPAVVPTAPPVQVAAPAEADRAAARPRPLRPLELLPAVPGWQRWAHGSFPWAAGLFGPEARAERLVYRRGEGRLIWIDVLTCPRPEDLARHTIAGCFDSHAYRVERQEVRELRGQEVGTWVVADAGGLRWAVAAWTQPQARLPSGTAARRCVLWRRVDAGAGEAELGELRTLAEGLLGAAARR